MNTPELNKYFSVNNLYDNTTNNSRLLQFYDTTSTVWLTEEERCHPHMTALALSCTAWDFTLG